MSRHALALPIRALNPARQVAPQWICRRCLATQAEDSASTTPIPPAKTTTTTVTPTPDYDPSLPSSQRIGPDGKVYRLKKSDFYLKKPLQQERIPIAYLQHSTSEILHENERAQREKTTAHKKIVGVVVSAGKMDKTVKVRIATQTWNKRIGKYFRSHEDHLTHDPNNSLVEGDVVELHRLRSSRQVGHVVASIVSPFGTPIESRPPVPTADERLAAYKEYRFAKLKRRTLRRKAADGDAEAMEELRSMGLDPGAGTEPGAGKKGNVQSQVVESRNPGKGAILGARGQKLPAGVLPGGKHEVGRIDERAKHNKGKQMKFEQRAGEQLREARRKEVLLEEEEGLSSDSALR